MEGVILSTAKNPGEPSTVTPLAGFYGGLRRFANLTSTSPNIYRRYITATATTWVAAALFLAAVAPPMFFSHGQVLNAVAIHAFFSKLCHQRPGRALYLFGAPTAVCVRCLGIYAGAAVGSLLRLKHRFALSCLGAALALNLLDVTAEFIGFHGNMPLLRLLIGATLGIAVGAMLSAESLSRISNPAFTNRPPDFAKHRPSIEGRVLRLGS
jgi:uncharacterized membrane protein